MEITPTLLHPGIDRFAWKKRPETTDVAYKTRDGRPESFQVEDDYFQVLDQWEELDSSVRRGDKALFGWKLRNDGELARRPE
jgi:hypothetical protein